MAAADDLSPGAMGDPSPGDPYGPSVFSVVQPGTGEVIHVIAGDDFTGMTLEQRVARLEAGLVALRNHVDTTMNEIAAGGCCGSSAAGARCCSGGCGPAYRAGYPPSAKGDVGA